MELSGLEVLLPPTAAWFRATLGAPTAPQRAGWPKIAAGKSTLICAPTGSGKTLAAFLACLDHLWRTSPARSVRILYISPLKALNNDIARNLELPLAGVPEYASRMGMPLRPLSVGIRTGDTPSSERQSQVRRPPEILITTPESLHLLLTSKAREVLREVTHVIVDEIHAVCGNKRGVFLAILLERLERNCSRSFVRIGLSATQKPLEEVARYLGGLRLVHDGSGAERYDPRPVEIVDAGLRKELDLEVSFHHSSQTRLRAGTTWPAIEAKLLDWISEHRSTIVFANNRRVVERTAAALNRIAAEAIVSDTQSDAPPLARAHHGSVSLEERRTVEESLKSGELSAVVATASLELGIDMGAVDLVCQVESPGSVSRGLQRVGRSGHVVGQKSKGRIIAKTPPDLLESAALARAMLRGEVEHLRVPTNCLDLLAQQVIACVAVEPWDAGELLKMVRGAYPYRDLAPEAFENVLAMTSGRYPAPPVRDMQARVHWDRLENRLHALPGSTRLAVTGGGAITDTGAFPVYLGDGGPKLGELDEEFVFERRVGDTFALGTSTWKIESIDVDRVLVSRSEGSPALPPFWRGEKGGRSYELGLAAGALARKLTELEDDAEALAWLAQEYPLDLPARENLLAFHRRQKRHAGVVPDDRNILIEAFLDPAGEQGLAVLSPLGGRLHQALKLLIQGRLRDRFGVLVTCLHSSDGVLVRIPRMEQPPLDLLDGLLGPEAERLVRRELGESALFGLRFRQNAGRALLMPRPDPGKRTPLWLQRLRAKDLLQIAGKFADYPVVVETYRECLAEDLDIERLKEVLEAIAAGAVHIHKRDEQIPSPFTSAMIFEFQAQYIYEWDEPRRGEPRSQGVAIDGDQLDLLLPGSEIADAGIDPGALATVEGRLRRTHRPPRTEEELAQRLVEIGDVTDGDIGPAALRLAEELAAQGRARRITLAGTDEPDRWISEEHREQYARAFGEPPDLVAMAEVVKRFLMTRVLVDLDVLLARYPIGVAIASDLLEKWADAGLLDRVDSAAGRAWGTRENLIEARRVTLAIRRRETVAVSPEAFADFVARRQCVHPAANLSGREGLDRVLENLEGFAAVGELWETEILPRRVANYRPALLDEALAAGRIRWRAFAPDGGEPLIAFHERDFAGHWPSAGGASELSDVPRRVWDALEGGARYLDEIAHAAGVRPSAAWSALVELMHMGLVSNDRLDPVRPGAKPPYLEIDQHASAPLAARAIGPGARRMVRRRVRSSGDVPMGRWQRIEVGDSMSSTAAEERIPAWCWVLLDRYGVLARETAELDPWAPPWSALAPVLAKSEWRGEVRRGYFVEGLSGVQFATAEAADQLAELASQGKPAAVPFLISSLDPANLFGASGPFGGSTEFAGGAKLVRSKASYVVLRAGRPVLAIEGGGKRIASLPTATPEELRAGLELVKTLAGPARRVIKVESFNQVATLASPIVPIMTELGFVRDPPGMAYYRSGW